MIRNTWWNSGKTTGERLSEIHGGEEINKFCDPFISVLLRVLQERGESREHGARILQ